MNNIEIVKILEDIAGFLDLKGESIFKSRAYRRAARSIELLSEDVGKLVAEDRLREIPGVGEAIAKKLTELVTTGRLDYYEKLRSEFPASIATFLEIPGIGPRTALIITGDLGVTSVDELEQAILSGRLAQLPRMGEKTVQNILRQIQAYRKKKSQIRVPQGAALPGVDSLVFSLRNIPGLKSLAAAGSLRRFRDTVGDIDLVGSSDSPEAVIQAFTTLPQVQEVLEKGSTKASVMTKNGFPADFPLVDLDSFGSALQHSTGSKQHNIELRKRAERMGLSLSEYGITVTSTGKLEKYQTEEAFYQRQGLDYIPPEIREGTREIELAEKGALPQLVETKDVKGDLHVHTNWSDGGATLEEMVLAARERGYQYIGITDHSGGLGIARGLKPDPLQKQIQDIKPLNQTLTDFSILTGIEVDILADGSLDIPDELLAELDIVLASVHSAMSQSEEQMTRRITRAMENKYVHVLCHPTARLLGEREPVALNMEQVLRAALENEIVLEINSMPARLDLNDIHIFQARNKGIKLVINTDSHRPEHLDFISYGVGTARRGWCQSSDIINTLPLDKLMAFLNAK